MTEPPGASAPSPVPSIAIIIGCYNAAKHVAGQISRIHHLLASRGLAYEIVAVEDGSADGTLTVLQDLATRMPSLTILRNPRNMGKGFSIRSGILNSRADHVVFVDADMAYSTANVEAVIDRLLAGVPIVVGNRRLPNSVYTVNNALIRYVYRRHRLGMAFNILVRLLFGLRIRDTQSGLKGFRREVANAVFPAITTDGFLFDVEVFIRAAALGIEAEEVPVHVTYDSDESTVRQFRMFLRIVPELTSIKVRQMRGRYRSPAGAGVVGAATSTTSVAE